MQVFVLFLQWGNFMTYLQRQKILEKYQETIKLINILFFKSKIIKLLNFVLKIHPNQKKGISAFFIKLGEEEQLDVLRLY